MNDFLALGLHTMEIVNPYKDSDYPPKIKIDFPHWEKTPSIKHHNRTPKRIKVERNIKRKKMARISRKRNR